MATRSTKAVLRKISNNKNLNKKDKEVLDDLISALKKSLRGRNLNKADRKIIKETIQKSEAGLLGAEDLIAFVKGGFQLWDFFKDYS